LRWLIERETSESHFAIQRAGDGGGGGRRDPERYELFSEPVGNPRQSGLVRLVTHNSPPGRQFLKPKQKSGDASASKNQIISILFAYTRGGGGEERRERERTRGISGEVNCRATSF